MAEEIEPPKERFYDERDDLTCGECGACKVPRKGMFSDPYVGMCIPEDGEPFFVDTRGWCVL